MGNLGIALGSAAEPLAQHLPRGWDGPIATIVRLDGAGWGAGVTFRRLNLLSTGSRRRSVPRRRADGQEISPTKRREVAPNPRVRRRVCRGSVDPAGFPAHGRTPLALCDVRCSHQGPSSASQRGVSSGRGRVPCAKAPCPRTAEHAACRPAHPVGRRPRDVGGRPALNHPRAPPPDHPTRRVEQGHREEEEQRATPAPAGGAAS